MPLLKYICEDCGHVYEELVTGDKTPDCPKCGAKRVKRYYRGKCYFGATGCSDGAGSGGGCSCGGSCGSCSGCH